MRAVVAHRAWCSVGNDRGTPAGGRRAARDVCHPVRATRRHHVSCPESVRTRRDHARRDVTRRASGDASDVTTTRPPANPTAEPPRPPVRGGAPPGAPVMVEEVSTGGAQTRRWTRSPNGGFVSLPPVRANAAISSTETSSSAGRLANLDPRTSPRLRRIFLPAGYPESVSRDYAPFIRWHLGSLVFRNVLEVLTSQSLLVALGMGSAPGALPLTAATKWVLKDGLGSLATLAAGSLGGQKYDEDPKRWWAATNALEDAARAIELATPAFPAAFLPLAASATFVRSAALTGRGSLMNGTFMQHLSRNENLGDVRAKLEVQGRWLALVALPVGIGIFRSVSSAFDADAGEGAYRYAATLGAYGAVIFGHTFCCWKAADVLRFDTLNRARLCKMTRAFVDAETDEWLNGEAFRETETRENARRGGAPARSGALVALPGVDAAGAEEGVYRARFAADAPTLGASLPECARDWDDLEGLLRLSSGASPREKNGFGKRRKYALGWDAARGTVSALLDADAEPHDVMAAALAATKAAVDSKRASERSFTQKKTKTRRLEPGVAKAAYAYADARFETFEASARAAGWRADFVQMGTAPKYRLETLNR